MPISQRTARILLLLAAVLALGMLPSSPTVLPTGTNATTVQHPSSPAAEHLLDASAGR